MLLFITPLAPNGLEKLLASSHLARSSTTIIGLALFSDTSVRNYVNVRFSGKKRLKPLAQS